MSPTEALALVREHGVMLESGTGPVPSLAPAIVGTSIRGSWWSHPQSREIFALTRAIRGCPDVLVCRLIDKKITYVHRRLWSALVRLSGRFSSNQLAQICEVHTPFGKHIIQEVQFPSWVPEEVAEQASTIGEDDALGQLGRWCAKKNSVPAGA